MTTPYNTATPGVDTGGGGGGGGSVNSVTAADTSITVGGTAVNPTVATGTLDIIAADHPPAGDWSNNGHQITNLSAIAVSGLTGATTPSRHVGATISGPPQSGTFAVGDTVIGQDGPIWVCYSAGTPGLWRQTTDQPWQFRPETYGAKGDIKVFKDGVMTNGTAILTSATANFTSSDVGKSIIVNVGAAGANQAPLITTILSFQSSTQVTLNANAPAGATGNPFAYGTDDTAALQSAWAAAQAYANNNQSRTGSMVLSKMYVMAGLPVKGQTAGPFVNSYGYSLLPVNVPDLTGSGPKMNIILETQVPGDGLQYWEQLTGQVAGCGIFAMSAAPGTDATWGIPSIVGGPTVASGGFGSFTGGFANIRLHIRNVQFAVPYNPGWIGIDGRFLTCLTGERYGYQMFTVGVLSGGNGPNLGSVPGGSWNFNGAGIRFPVMNNNDLSDFDTVIIEGVADALWIADHVSIRMSVLVNNANAIVFDNTNGSGSGSLHGCWFGEVSAEAQTNNLIVTSGSKVTSFPLNIDFLDSENSTTPNLVTDTGVLVGTINWYDIHATTVPKISGTTGLKINSLKVKPGLMGSPPAVPATGVAVSNANLPWRDAWVNVQPNGATISSIVIGATTVTGITSGYVFVPSGVSITLNYTVATPAWQWWLA